MKIISEDSTRLAATDKTYVGYIVGPIFALIGLSILVANLAHLAPTLLLFGGIFVVVGVLAVLATQQRSLLIDKTAGTLTFTIKSILKNGTYPYQLADIARLQLVTSYDTRINDSGTNRTPTQNTRLFLVLKDGTHVDLAEGSRSMSLFSVFSKTPNQAVAQRLAAYIGVPFEEASGAANLGQIVSTIKAAASQAAAPSVVAAPASVAEPVPTTAPAAAAPTSPPAEPNVAPAQPAAPTETAPAAPVATPPPAPTPVPPATPEASTSTPPPPER